MKNLKTASDQQLLLWFRNARTTYAGCAGFHKAEMNMHLMNQYKLELLERGAFNSADTRPGLFNGEGSF